MSTKVGRAMTRLHIDTLLRRHSSWRFPSALRAALAIGMLSLALQGALPASGLVSSDSDQLTPDQRLQRLTNDSKAIVLGEYIGKTTRLVNPVLTAEGTIYDVDDIVLVRPLRWLKGTGSSAVLEVLHVGAVGLPNPLSAGNEEHSAPTVICFMNPLPPNDPRRSAEHMSEKSYLLNQTSFYGWAGLVPLTNGDNDSLLATVEHDIQDESLVQHLQSCTLVVLATTTDSLVSCGRPRPCQVLQVEETLKGSIAERFIRLESLRMPMDRATRVVVFADPRGADTWIGIGAFAGVRRLDAGGVEGSGMSLDQVRSQIRELQSKTNSSGSRK